MTLMDRPEVVRIALTPPRRELLDRLREPASATQLATELGLPRQRVNYHLRTLEQAGLIELVEQRQRRGCVERIMRATSESYVVDPSVMRDDAARAADAHSAERLVELAADTVRQVARIKGGAESSASRLLTFSIEAEVRFRRPADAHRFTDAVVAAIASAVAEFDTPEGRPYRILAGGHPAPASTGDDEE